MSSRFTEASWEFPKIRVTFSGVPIVRVIVLGFPYLPLPLECEASCHALAATELQQHLADWPVFCEPGETFCALSRIASLYLAMKGCDAEFSSLEWSWVLECTSPLPKSRLEDSQLCLGLAYDQ